MNAQEILHEIESQALSMIESYNAEPVYVVISREMYRTLVRHFRKENVRGSDSKRLAQKVSSRKLGFEKGILKFVVVDQNILAVSSDQTEELFRSADGKSLDSEIFGEQ